MKKMLMVVLVTVIGAVVSGYFIWYRYTKSQIQEATLIRIKQGIKKSDLIKLSFHKDDVRSLIHWRRDNEFEFNYEMYDVIELVSDGDSLNYWCWHDISETDFNKRFVELEQSDLDKPGALSTVKR